MSTALVSSLYAFRPAWSEPWYAPADDELEIAPLSDFESWLVCNVLSPDERGDVLFTAATVPTVPHVVSFPQECSSGGVSVVAEQSSGASAPTDRIRVRKLTELEWQLVKLLTAEQRAEALLSAARRMVQETIR